MNPITPIMPMPIAEILAVMVNSFREGFLSACQTLLLLEKNCFNFDANVAIMIVIMMGF